jgi:hypothetical protein
MIEHVRKQQKAARTKIGRRRLRLFCCACLRRVWPRIELPDMREVVVLCERFADGLADRNEMVAARRLEHRWRTAKWSRAVVAPLLCNAVASAADPDSLASRASIVASYVRMTCFYGTYADRTPVGGPEQQVLKASEAVAAAETTAQADLVRDIFGNPFRLLPKRKFPADMRSLARSCYEGDAAAYPILADALADLGEEAAAAHCRQAGHVKGCHVVDWVLGNDQGATA